MRGIALWMLGVPIRVILLMKLFGVFRRRDVRAE